MRSAGTAIGLGVALAYGAYATIRRQRGSRLLVFLLLLTALAFSVVPLASTDRLQATISLPELVSKYGPFASMHCAANRGAILWVLREAGIYLTLAVCVAGLLLVSFWRPRSQQTSTNGPAILVPGLLGVVLANSGAGPGLSAQACRLSLLALRREDDGTRVTRPVAVVGLILGCLGVLFGVFVLIGVAKLALF